MKSFIRLGLLVGLLFTYSLSDDYKTIQRPNSFNTQNFKRVALVIGNDNYEISPLSNAVYDANAMKDFLESKDFKVIYAKNANEQTMRSKVAEFLALLNSKSVGFIYYSGHGIQEYSQNERRTVNYLIPTNNAQFKSLTDLDYHALSLNYILDSLSEKKNGLNIVLLDACRTPFKAFSRSTQSGLAPSNAKGVYIAYATADGEKALDNGLFRRSFIKYAQQPLKLIEIFENVKEDVYNKTHQFPYISNGKIGSFYFVEPNIIPIKDKSITVEEQQKMENCKGIVFQSIFGHQKNFLGNKINENMLKNCQSLNTIEGKGYFSIALYKLEKENKSTILFNGIQGILERKCKEDDFDACTILGYKFILNKNYNKAEKIFKNNCELGDGFSCTNIGIMYGKGGFGISRDNKKGVKYLKKACNLNDSMGCTVVGMFMIDGDFVKKDVAKGKRLLENSCNMDNSLGCMMLGAMYIEGKGGIPKNPIKGMSYILKSCGKGDDFGICKEGCKRGYKPLCTE